MANMSTALGSYLVIPSVGLFPGNLSPVHWGRELALVVDS